MKSRHFAAVLVCLLMSPLFSAGQKLKPGFDKEEYIELLKVFSLQGDSAFYREIPKSKKFRHIYRSPVVGLDNRWDLAISDDSVAVISIRGTTANLISWAANFYAAMVPAHGELQLSEDFLFQYKLAQHPRAAVHLGWLICTAFLSADILPKIDSLYARGVKDYFICGHSQGGAIAYLLTSQLRYLQREQALAPDMVFKTYSSASPKPGNLYYAYDYEHITFEGWAFNVVNAADWVPETPVTVQTAEDHNTVNPFSDAGSTIRQQKFPRNLILQYMYGRLKRPAFRTQKRYRNYFGKLPGKMIKKELKGYKEPEFYPSSHYVRTGNHIVLFADEAYYRTFPDDKDRVFIHHSLKSYLYLAEKLPQ